MSIVIDSERGKKVARLLYNCFFSVGIHGRTGMPEDIMPNGIKKGSLEHILFITLTVSIDYQRDALSLWESSRKSFDDPETRYLFNPKSLYKTPIRKIVKDMQNLRGPKIGPLWLRMLKDNIFGAYLSMVVQNEIK